MFWHSLVFRLTVGQGTLHVKQANSHTHAFLNYSYSPLVVPTVLKWTNVLQKGHHFDSL